MNCSTSPGAASGRSVRMVSDGYEMSGSRSTESREAATSPKITSPAVTMKTVTGRLSDASTMRTGGLRCLRANDPDLRALLEPALAHGHDLVAAREPRCDLRGLVLDRAELDRHAHRAVAARHEHVVLAVLAQHAAPRHEKRAREAPGLEPDAREGAGPQ